MNRAVPIIADPALSTSTDIIYKRAVSAMASPALSTSADTFCKGAVPAIASLEQPPGVYTIHKRVVPAEVKQVLLADLAAHKPRVAPATGNPGTLPELLNRAWQVRQANFPPQVKFVFPFRTLAVSSTGEKCALHCAHCGGYYLKGMATIEEALAKKNKKVRSYLISGGYDQQGKVPHWGQWEKIKKLAARGALNLHTGLVTEGEAQKIAAVARVVSFDFVVDDETIHEVYGLSATGQDFINSFRFLRRYTRVIPHLCLGLKGGQMQGENRALQALQREKVEAVSLLVFTPTPGTRFASCPPPPLAEIGDFLARARIMFPTAPLYLGCMRPGGRYREALDQIALQAGINKIVQPVPAARRLALELGLHATRGEECCSL